MILGVGEQLGIFEVSVQKVSELLEQMRLDVGWQRV
jgi:hypothetical protein